MTEPATPPSAQGVASKLSIQEKLLLAQAVYKLGAVSWPGVSKLLLAHPCCISRPPDLFSSEACEGAYVELMTSIGINVPAPDGMKPQAKVHLRLAQTFYLARMQELQSQIASYESRFSELMRELGALRAGELDGEIRAELRATLARKYGKRLLDTWVPEEEDVKKAIADGPIKEGEVEAAIAGASVEVDEEQKVIEKNETKQAQTPDIESAQEDIVEEKHVAEEDGDEPTPKAGEDEEQPESADTAEPEEENELEARSETEAEAESSKTSSPAPTTRSELSPAPGSDLSPAPSDKATPTPTPTPAPEEEEAEEAPAPSSRRRNKRRASTQPRDAPASKRSGRRSAAAATATASPAPASDAASESGDVEMKIEEADDENADEDAEEEPEPEVPVTRGRRSTKRDRESTSRAPTSKKPQDSPAASTRTKDSSPAVSRRAPSVSSTASATPGGQEERRSGRRSLKGRGMRDDVVSKTVREQSAALESVKAEDDEDAEDAEEKKPTRASGRRRGTIVAPEVSTPSEKRGTRASARTLRPAARDPVDDESGFVDERERDSGSGHKHEGDMSVDSIDLTRDRERETRTASTSTATPVHGTRALRAQVQTQTQKASQKMLLSLLDTISSHRNGNVFQNPVKKSDAPSYFDVIKRPMDLKTIRSRVKDGQISNIDEFERDALLIFANATMYNGPESPVYEMAKEMMRDTEAHIRHFKSMQHY